MALLLLRGAVDPEGTLRESWSIGRTLCSWEGISCDTEGLVETM